MHGNIFIVSVYSSSLAILCIGGVQREPWNECMYTLCMHVHCCEPCSLL